MVAMNKWQDITDTEVSQGTKWLASVAEPYMLKLPTETLDLLSNYCR